MKVTIVTAASLLHGASGFGTFSADPSNGMQMGSMGMGSVSGEDMASLPMLSPEQEHKFSTESAEFVEGALFSFVGHTNIPAEEVDCMKENSEEVGGAAGSLFGQIGYMFSKELGWNVPIFKDASDNPFAGLDLSKLGGSMGGGDAAGDIGSIADSISAGRDPAFGRSYNPAPAPSPASHKNNAAQATMDFFYGQRRLQMLPGIPDSSGGGGGMMSANSIPAVMEMAVDLKKVIQDSRKLVQECIHSDVKQIFEKAWQNAKSLDHITKHMLGNGPLLVGAVADSVAAYEKKDVKSLGINFGAAMRKVFYSDSMGSGEMEATPDEAELGNVTSGLMQGFFGSGTYLSVNKEKDHQPPLRIDMQDCVHKNVPYFQQIWAASMYLFSQKAGMSDEPAARSAQTGDDNDQDLNSGAGKLQFGTTLAFMGMEMPDAMDKCGIDSDHQSMLMDSIKSFGRHMDAKVTLPKRDVPKKQLEEDLARTVEEWSKNSWFEFGVDLGRFMQDTAVHYMPQKYSVDENGVLRRFLEEQEQASTQHWGFLILCPALLVFAVASVAVRLRTRSRKSMAFLSVDAEDLERPAIQE